MSNNSEAQMGWITASIGDAIEFILNAPMGCVFWVVFFLSLVIVAMWWFAY